MPHGFIYMTSKPFIYVIWPFEEPVSFYLDRRVYDASPSHHFRTGSK